VKNLIPHFIQEQYLSNNWQGELKGYTLFVDLSGFTPLTEALMKQGNKGAEQLSNILNEIFHPLVRMVYAKGGFIPYFAGDAFTAIFPESIEGITARHVVYAAMQAREMFSLRKFRFGKFTIGVKFGLSYGTVEWGIVGKNVHSYYFRGYPIDSCANCQTKAQDQDIVIDRVLSQLLEKEDFYLKKIEDGYFKLWGMLPDEALALTPVDLPAINEDVALAFLPQAVVEYTQEGEFRSVISVFISFEGVETYQLMNDFASIILDRISSFSGYFKEIDYGDKGGVMVAFFGAPVTFENNIDRAMEFVATIRDEIREIQIMSGLQYRIGVTIGTAYTGIVGGHERCQYAAVGNRVNLSARLMTQAEWGEVLVDEEVQKDPHFNFQHRGNIHYKGIKGNVPTFKLLGRNYENRSTYAGEMVGRQKELSQLIDFSQPIFKDRTAGVAYVYGEAGIGKSRLMYELKNIFIGEQLVRWHTCQVDQILKKPFNPFIYFLKNFFEQYPESTSLANIQNFELHYQIVIDELETLTLVEAQIVKRELVRTKSVLAALIGLNYQDSIWDVLDAKGRYQNTIAAIINLIVAQSLIQPLVLEIEDGHWLDDNSRELLNELVRQINQYPILLLITSRYLDDGTKPTIVDSRLLTWQKLPLLEIDLNILEPAAVFDFAVRHLGGEPKKEFFEQLLRMSNSNPFYLQQILEYFTESDLLQFEEGKWGIKDEDIKLSTSINAILTARIDRLSMLVKETVKAAAVIGREFEVPILNEVMKTQEEFRRSNGNASKLVKEQIKHAENGQIWHAMNELRYIFKHSLLREAVYDMQLRARLQQVHLHIAEAIERLYADNLEERFVDLAFHYEQADVFDKTCEYLRKAADYARNNYQNQRALDYYEKLLKHLGTEKDNEDEIKTLLKKGKILEQIGSWEECQQAYEKALFLSKKSRDVLLLGHSNNSLGHLLLLKGAYQEATGYLHTAAGLFESIEDQSGKAKVYGNLGELYFRQGKYSEAKDYFGQSLEISNRVKHDATANARVAANLGLTFMNQGDYDEGIRYMKAQLVVNQRDNDKQGMATLYTNMGIVYFEKGDYDEALDSYKKGLELSEELGNKLLTAIAIGSIGSIYERKGDYKQAMDNFQRDLELCEELGDKQGIAIALGLIGELYSVEGQFKLAIEYLQKNLMLCEELGYQKGIAKAVNTLGDVFYFTKQYDRSLHFYDRAIEVTRRIDNKLVLGMSLAEKGLVLLAINQLEKLPQIVNETLEIANELGNPDLLFDAQMLSIKQRIAEEQTTDAQLFLEKLLRTELSKEQEAAVHFELYRLKPEDLVHRKKAIRLYKKLYKHTPKYIYKHRLDRLRS
jgi:tetratricopeptide (TPR) repeat protein/class 3 adenylate cyclase